MPLSPPPKVPASYRVGLAVGLGLAAARWHGSVLPTRVSYWARPYDWQRDGRCWRWRRTPCRIYEINRGTAWPSNDDW